LQGGSNVSRGLSPPPPSPLTLTTGSTALSVSNLSLVVDATSVSTERLDDGQQVFTTADVNCTGAALQTDQDHKRTTPFSIGRYGRIDSVQIRPPLGPLPIGRLLKIYLT